MMVTEKPVPASPCGQYIKTTHELGKGAQRTVFRGNDLRSGRCVSWCEPKLKGDKDWENFTKSSSLLENVKHKNIVAFMDFWEASPTTTRTPVLITELLSCNLKEHMHHSPRGFESSAVKSWASQIVEALVYLQSPHHHLRHVIAHRTLKCDHVCINRNSGEVKISSFGTAVLKERGKFLEEMVGDFHFMSPEMAVENYNEVHDIYSYGLLLLHMITGEEPYEEHDKITQTLQCLKSERYPKVLEKVKDAYTRDLIRSCIEHNQEKRLTLNQIVGHRYFQSPLSTGCMPKIAFHSFDGDLVTISISMENQADMKLYSFNFTTDQSRYVAASLVRGEYIQESHLQDATVQLHKLIEKVKRQTRIKNDMMDFYGPLPQQIPVSSKPPKAPKIALTLCSFDSEENHVELELSQTRIGKIIKFQFGIMDNEAEEIADRLVKEGHLIADNKAEFITQLSAIVQERREVVLATQPDNSDTEDSPTEEGSRGEEEPMEIRDQPTSEVDGPGCDGQTDGHKLRDSVNNTDLSIEVRRKTSRDNSTSNQVVSPDIDNRSIHSETSSSIPIDNSCFSSVTSSKSMTNGVDSMISPPNLQHASSYYRPATQPGMMFYPPQYMMMPPPHTGPGMPHPGTPLQPHPQLPSNYVVMPAGHLPSSIYTNGHLAGWGHGAPIVRSQHDLNSMRMPVPGSSGPISYVNQSMELGVRGDQDTPPPISGYAQLDCRSES